MVWHKETAVLIIPGLVEKLLDARKEERLFALLRDHYYVSDVVGPCVIVPLIEIPSSNYPLVSLYSIRVEVYSTEFKYEVSNLINKNVGYFCYSRRTNKLYVTEEKITENINRLYDGKSS